jgi:hypothetical protein
MALGDVVHIVPDETARREARHLLVVLADVPGDDTLLPVLRGILAAVAEGRTAAVVTGGPDLTAEQAAALLRLPVDTIRRLGDLGVGATSLATAIQLAVRLREGGDTVLSDVVAGKDVARAVADYLVRHPIGDVPAPFPGNAGDLDERLRRWG